MSSTPLSVAPCGKEPTSVGLCFSLMLARPSAHEFPHGNKESLEPLRAANSHSSSEGKRYLTTSRYESHAAKSSASLTETLPTGQRSRPGGGLLPFHGSQ